MMHVKKMKTENYLPKYLGGVEIIKKKLSDVEWGFSDSNTSYLTHGIHPYPAKFIPQIASNLIKILSNPKDVVWDPFCGSGTTALECILASRHSINTDINPLSKIIGEAKTTNLDKEIEDELQNLLERIDFLLDPKTTHSVGLQYHTIIDEKIPDIPHITKWFHKNAISELSLLRTMIQSVKNEKAKNIALLAFSKTIARVSNQEEETRYASTPKDIPKQHTLKVFFDNLRGIYEKLSKLKAEGLIFNASFFTMDLRKEIVGNEQNFPIKNNTVDLIVTSPPYPNATDYHLYQRFRLFWLGFDPRILAKSEIGSHLRHQKENTGFKEYLHEMKLCMENMFNALKHDRYVSIIIGDAIFNKQIFKTSDGLSKIAKEIGFENIMTIKRQLHSTRRSFIKAGRRAISEDILILRKP